MGSEALYIGSLIYLIFGLVGCCCSSLCFRFGRITRDSKGYYWILLFIVFAMLHGHLLLSLCGYYGLVFGYIKYSFLFYYVYSGIL